MSSYTGVISF